MNSHRQWRQTMAMGAALALAAAVASAATAPMIAAGNWHTMILKGDGTIWGWGYNSYGQLGNGKTASCNTNPVQASGISNAVAVSGGHRFSAAVLSDGSVWAWGQNYFGQLGIGNNADSLVPVQVVGLSNVVALACGNDHTLAVKCDGSIWTWGRNEYGQLGNGTTNDSNVPVQVGLSNVVAIAAGSYHALAMKSDGSVWAWGDNSRGQLGDGTETDRLLPTRMTGGVSNAIAVAAGDMHSLILKSDGTLLGCGGNVYGQLGLGHDPRYFSVPTNAFLNVTGITDISCRGDISLARRRDGTVWVSGYNYYGQLGDGTTDNVKTPKRVGGVGIIQVVASGTFSLALKGDGTMFASGYNNYGQLGDGTTVRSLVPVQVVGLTMTKLTGVSAGGNFSLIQKADGSVWGVGANQCGQLANGTKTSLVLPRQTMFNRMSVMGGGATNSLGLRCEGTVWSCGANANGQLGNGTAIDAITPVAVSMLASSVTAIAVGHGDHALGLKSDGTVWAWGANEYGQLGLGSISAPRIEPAQVAGLSNVVAVAAGHYHSLAIKGDGTVWAWGRNDYGLLGDGTTTMRTEPVPVQGGLADVTAIACGAFHSLARRSDGTVWAWGLNNAGQLGDGSTSTRLVPVRVQGGQSNVTAIAAGSGHSLALLTSGRVAAWGWNARGQLGDGTTNNHALPVYVQGGVSNVTAIAAGWNHSVARKANGSVRAWGLNDMGQLGNGTTNNCPTPDIVGGGTNDDGSGGAFDVPSCPENVSASYGNYPDWVEVTWTGVPDAASYEVWRNMTNDSSTAELMARDIVPTASQDYTAQLNVPYYYWVRAVNTAGTSIYSAVACGAMALSAPAGVTASAGLYTDTVRIQWGEMPCASGYQVWRNTDTNTATATNLATAVANNRYDDTAAAAGVSYYYWVTAVSIVTSAFSEPCMGWMAVYATVPGDYDGDGKADPGIYLQSNGNWTVKLSTCAYADASAAGFGGAGYSPVFGDYDGDRKLDLAVYRASAGDWYFELSSAGYLVYILPGFGGPAYGTVSGDFDGDGKSDPAIYDEANGLWGMALSGSGYGIATTTLGGPGYSTVSGDFDGDGKADPAVYDEANGIWGMALSASGYGTATASLGGLGCTAVAGDFDGDGKADPAVYAEATGLWSIMLSAGGYATATTTQGGWGFSALAGDYDGDRKADPAVYQRATGAWQIRLSASDYAAGTLTGFGGIP